MKKLVCLVAVLALAGIVSADPVWVIKDGIIQSSWVSGGTGGGNGPFSDGGCQSKDPGSWGGWISFQSYPNMTPTDPYNQGNKYLELNIRLDTDGQGAYTADEIGAFHILVNPTNRWDWEWKWEGASLCSVDGAPYQSFTASGPNGRPVIPLDTGYHTFTLDLETNSAGGGPGGIWPVGASVHDIMIALQGGDGGFNVCISDMAFTATGSEIPEPATITLLGLGGLALFRRKH